MSDDSDNTSDRESAFREGAEAMRRAILALLEADQNSVYPSSTMELEMQIANLPAPEYYP